MVPRIKYLILISESYEKYLNNSIQTSFKTNTINLIKYYKLDEDTQTQIIYTNYNGQQNHKGIMTTYNKPNQKLFWPNMIKDITQLIIKYQI